MLFICSNVVGKSSGDLRMCESLFPCDTSVEDIKNEALLVTTAPDSKATGLFATLFAPTMTTDTFNPSTELRESRSTCKITGALCPGITIGCALCGVFAPGTCGDTCIIAGLYCGTSGYACQFEASQNSADEGTVDQEEGGDEEDPAEEEPEEEEPEEDAEEERKRSTRPRFYPFHY